MSSGSAKIEGASAAEIVASVRSLVARGGLEDGTVLPLGPSYREAFHRKLGL